MIGKEIKNQVVKKGRRLPGAIVACGSGGSNAISAFRPFIQNNLSGSTLLRVEEASLDADNSAAAFQDKNNLGEASRICLPGGDQGPRGSL